MPLSVADLRLAVERAGGKLERAGGGRSTVYQCVAPDGMTWNASDTMLLVVQWRGSCSSPVWPEEKQLALADGIEQAAAGASPCGCDDPECEVCRPEPQ
jgi:hypothetical protein